MKTRTLITMTSALILSLAAAHSMAAGTNPPKPRCPMGQIPVLEQGHWQCKEPSIQSNSSGAESRTATPGSVAVPTRTASDKKQAAEKPDFKIVAVKKMPSPGAYRVTVKNTGDAYGATQANVWATLQKADGSTNGAAANMPQVFGAGEQKYIDIKFVPANIDRGDKITFTVDSFKVVAEKNENNNTYSMKI